VSNSALLTLAMACMPAGSAYLWSVWGARLLRGAPAGASWLMWALLMLPAVSTLGVVLIRPRLKAAGLRMAFSLVVGFIGLWIAAAVLWQEWIAAGPAPEPGVLLLWRLSFIPIPLASIALWLWGEWVGHGAIGPRDVRIALSRNVMSILLLYLFYNSAPLLAEGEALGPVVTIFVCGVMALAASNLERLRVQREGTAVAPLLDRYWLQTVAGLIALLLLVGLLITGLAGTRLFAQIGSVLLLALAAVAIGVSWILVAIGVIVFILLYPLRALFQAVATRMVFPTPAPTSPALATALAAAPPTAAPAPSPIFDILGWAIAVGVVAAIVFMVFWLRLRAAALPREEEAEEVRESILSGDLLWNQLRSLFGGRGSGREKSSAAYLRLNDGTHASRVRIRRAYQRALQWAYERGRVRAPSVTPRGFETALRELSSDQAASRALTAAYEPARYDGVEPSSQMADEAEAALATMMRPGQAEASEDRS